MSYFQVLGSRNGESEGNENEFGTDLSSSSLVFHPLRSPLNAIQDPLQNPRENQEIELDARGKSGVGRNGKKIETLSYGTPKVGGRGGKVHLEPSSAQSTPARSSLGKASNSGVVGACVGSRPPLRDSRGGGLSRGFRGMSIMPSEQFMEVPHFELVEDPSFWMDHNVQVLVRIRPMSTSEKALQGNVRCLRQDSSQSLTWLGHPETRFTFDHIACETISQEKLFKVAGLPMVENCMSGYNSCMFAYGQTGSGKTYTMMGEIHEMDGKLNEDCGMTPRIFEYLFTRIREEEERRSEENLKYSCKCSFLEIYNEHIIDLLEPSSTNLQIREDMKKGVYVENLTEYEVTTAKDVVQLLLEGATNRKMAATNMNSESSRSHSVFTCVIESRWDMDSMTHLRFGRLNLVDLAGSERQKSSGAEGERLKEAANINKSLSTLGLVINTLVVVAHGKHRHVPYRDSRLTFLLQDSLGGNSKTTIIANINPSTCSANETLSTLKFAQRAKLIQNNAKVNEDASGDVLALQRQIQQLKDQLTFFLKHQNFPNSLPFSLSNSEKSLSGELSETHNSLEGGVSVPYNRTNIPKRKMKCIKATLSGALRREKMSETRVRSLEAEIEHMNRLVHQQQEDAQRTKMILRFREEKIKKLEMLSDGLLSADEYLMEENNALSEEIQLLQEKIDRNPELTRFALENLRILEQLRMFQDFYEQGEKEVILAEVSDLRDQLVDALEGTYEHLKAPSTEQDKGTGKELEHCRRNLDACLEMNEKLTREVDQLRRELNSAFHTAADSSCIDAGLVETTDKSSSVEIVSIRNDLENKISSYNPLPTKNNMEMDNALALQSSVSDDKKELMDARTLIEEMEQQQLFLIEELNTLQKKNCVYEDLLKKKDSEELESQLKVRKDCNALGRHWKTEDRDPENAGLLVEGSGDNIMPDLQTKLDRLNRELEEARILNQQYQNDHTSHVFHQTETEEVRQQVEGETAETILHLQEELSSLQQELMDKLNPITEENARLRNTIKARDDELRSLSEDWEKAMLELTNFLTDGCRSLEDASGHITSIASSFPERNVWISEHVEMAKKIFLEKESTIMQLQMSLEDAQEMGVELKLNLSSLKEATVAITEVRQLENDGNSREVIELQTALRDKMSAIKELESKLKCKDDQMIEALRQTDAASFDHDKYRNAGMMDEVDAQAVEIIQAQVEMAKQMFLETETVLIASYADAERYLASFKSEIVYTSSLLSKLVHEFTEDIRTMNKTFRDQNGQVKPRMLESLEAEEAEVGCNNNREMHLKFANDSLITDEKMEMNNSFIIKFEEARATLEEAEVMLNALLKANEEAKHMTDTWKQVGEELMIERVGLIEEVQQLKSSMFLKEGECESMQDQMLASLEDMADSVSSLQISFLQMKREVEESFKILYTDIVSLGQDLSNSIFNSRSSLEDIWSDIVEKGFALFVMYQCYVGSSSKKISSFKSDFGSFQPLQKNFYSIVNDVEKRRLGAMEEKSLFKGINNIEDHSEDLPYRLSNSGYVAELQNSYEMIEKLEEEELGLTPDCMMSENLLLRTKLARKDELLKGLLFDISLLQESISNSKDFKDEAEKMFMALTRTQHELAIKTAQLDDHILCHRKLEAKLVDSEGASFTSNSELAKTKETLDSLSKQNSELRVLLEDLQVKKSTLEGKLEEQKEVVRSLENEIIHMDFSIEERILASVENIEDELRRTIGERDRLLEEVASLNDKLEMANALADENEAIAVEARQESESSKLYAEQKEEEANILEHSVEELEHTINVLEKKVHEMGEEVKRHRLMRDDLELELESLKLRMLTVTENLDPEYSNSENDEVQMSRLLEIQEFKKQLRVLEKERTDQAREIKECREYISELLLHAEAQASQYQQKYKMLEDMIREVKTDPSAFPCPSSAVDKAEKISTRTRGSSSPFRCIAGLVQQMNLEQDQELSVAKLRIEELETLASSRQKEVCMLNTRLAAAENMTHDVIRDLLGLKLDMTNYANLIDQHEVQKLVEGAQQKTEEYIAKEQEILQLRKQINDLVEERHSCIEELNEKEAEMLASHLTLEQLKQRDQMLVAQNQMLKMDKANLKRKISEMDEMLKKHCEPLQQQILQPRKMKENVFKVNEELGKRLTQSEKLLSGVNDELSLYFKSDRRNPNETVEQGLRNKRQAAAQEPEDD